MKWEVSALVLISLLVLSLGYTLRDNNSISSLQEKPEPYIVYPAKVEETIYAGFPPVSTNYSVVANITVTILNHQLKANWDFVITNRTGNSTILYIKSPSFGKLSLTLEGKQINTSKLSRYSLPLRYTQVILLNVTYPKDIPLHGTLEYETIVNSSFHQYILGDFVKFSPIYYPENYPSIIVFSTEWPLPVSPAGVLINSNSLHNPIPETYNLTLILPSTYTVLSDYYLPRIEHKDKKLVVTFKNIKPNPTNYRFIYIFDQNFFQKTKSTIRNATLVFYTPEKSYLDFQGLTNATTQIFWQFVKYLSTSPYQEVNVFFNPDVIFGEEFEYFGKGIAIIGLHGRYGFLDNKDISSTTAHELAHLWFGSYANAGRLDESLATFMELNMSNLTGESLDGREKRAVRDSKSSGISLAQAYQNGILDPQIRLSVQYNKGAFVFRSLQFVLGNETFFEGLRELLRECHGRECNLTDVQDVFEKVSGQDLDWFFKEWFYSTRVPDYEVENLSITQRDDKCFLTFEIIDKNNFTMPLEVEVMTSKEKLVKKVWIKGKAKVSFELNDKPTKITLDPNEWMINENKKYNAKEIEIEIN